MKKLLGITAVAAVVLLLSSNPAQARGGRGGCGGGCSMGCGYGGGCGFGGGCGYGGGFGGYGGCGFGGCGYGGGCGFGGYGGSGFGGCGFGGCGTIAGGCGIGGCGIGGCGIGYVSAPVSQDAVVVVNLPEDAQLTIDDEATTATSSERVFRTPDLEAGRDFHYTLKARYVQNGKEELITRTVTVRSGEVTRVDLSLSSSDSTETAMAR